MIIFYVSEYLLIQWYAMGSKYGYDAEMEARRQLVELGLGSTNLGKGRKGPLSYHTQWQALWEAAERPAGPCCP